MIQMIVNILHTMGMRFVSYSVNAQKLTHVPNVFPKQEVAIEPVVETLLVKWLKMFLSKSLLLRVSQIVGKQKSNCRFFTFQEDDQISKPVFWTLCNNVINVCLVHEIVAVIID